MSMRAYSSYTIVDLIDGLEWKGNLSSAPANPKEGWAYHNIYDKKSYIYTGTQWVIFVQNGESSYVHVRYRANADDTTLTTTPNDYMGVYSGTSSTAPTSIASYTWYNVKGAAGAPGTDSVIFQIYSSNGYILSKDLKDITLQTFAYKGSTEITSGATYQWAYSIGNGWTDISGATNPYLNVVHTDVADSKSYKCTMTFEGLTYAYVVTIEDKSDIRQTYTSKPSSYEEGDLWVVGDDYIPNKFSFGSILKATQTRDTYSDADWISATKYEELSAKLEEYNQYFKLDKIDGITMTAIDQNKNPSPFSTTLSNNKLAFKQNDKEVAYINNEKLNITQAEIVSPLTITGQYSGSTMLQAPTLNIGNFSLVVESNGSLSIIANT